MTPVNSRILRRASRKKFDEMKSLFSEDRSRPFRAWSPQAEPSFTTVEQRTARWDPPSNVSLPKLLQNTVQILLDLFGGVGLNLRIPTAVLSLDQVLARFLAGHLEQL